MHPNSEGDFHKLDCKKICTWLTLPQLTVHSDGENFFQRNIYTNILFENQKLKLYSRQTIGNGGLFQKYNANR